MLIDAALPTVPERGFVIVAAQDQGDVTALGNSRILVGTITPPNYTNPAAFPDLVTFFARGGTITLLGPAGSTAKSVVISEIMWGRDSAQATVAGYRNRQWIELYNTSPAGANAGDNNVDLDATWELIFTQGHPIPTTAADLNGTLEDTDSNADTPMVLVPDRSMRVIVDQVSNVELGGWTVDIGQSGYTIAGENAEELISRYNSSEPDSSHRDHYSATVTGE